MYQVGQYIMYKNIGICIVEAIGKFCFFGEKEKEYYTLRPLYTNNNSRFYVPVDTKVFMRNAITKQEAYQYLEKLGSVQTRPFHGGKPAQLTAHYEGILTGYDLTDHLILFKELCQKEKKVKETGKKFGQLESNYKNQIEKLLANEFSHALNETPDLSKKRLYKALEL